MNFHHLSHRMRTRMTVTLLFTALDAMAGILVIHWVLAGVLPFALMLAFVPLAWSLRNMWQHTRNDLAYLRRIKRVDALYLHT